MARQRKATKAVPKYLRHAPIVEALVDLRVELPPQVGLDQIARIGETIRDGYPARRDRITMAGSITFNPEDANTPLAEAQQKVDGYAYESPDKQRVVQARLDGFTFSWLRPYETWEQLRDEARARWEDYRRLAEPQAVTRVGVRYLNRIEIPLPIRNLQDWVLSGPKVAPGLPQSLVGLFTQVCVPLPKEQIWVVLTEAFDAPGDRTDVLPLILDIDAGTINRRFDPADEAIWHLLERLRRIKNDFFFKSITSRTMRLFE